MPEYPWVNSVEASKELGITSKTLDLWREIGYLKEGTHWRYSYKKYSRLMKFGLVYHLEWCKEEMEYWKSHDAKIYGLVA